MGRIKYFKTQERQTVFPVTRSEAVLHGATTLDKILVKMRTDIDSIKTLDKDIAGAIGERPLNIK